MYYNIRKILDTMTSFVTRTPVLKDALTEGEAVTMRTFASLYEQQNPSLEEQESRKSVTRFVALLSQLQDALEKLLGRLGEEKQSADRNRDIGESERDTLSKIIDEVSSAIDQMPKEEDEGVSNANIMGALKDLLKNSQLLQDLSSGTEISGKRKISSVGQLNEDRNKLKESLDDVSNRLPEQDRYDNQIRSIAKFSRR